MTEKLNLLGKEFDSLIMILVWLFISIILKVFVLILDKENEKIKFKV